MIPIRISLSSLREGRWYEYLVRFARGGIATVLTGLISSRYGASVALPAIFCASAMLIEKHEIRRKREAGLLAPTYPLTSYVRQPPAWGGAFLKLG